VNASPTWVDEDIIIAVHDRLLALHGGAPGLRDAGLLQSALARARQRLAYGDAPDIIEMACDYASGLVKNHPFVDGNKRAGFMACVLFLELNGYRFTATEEDAANAVLALAAGEIDEEAFTAFLRRNTRVSNPTPYRSAPIDPTRPKPPPKKQS
jgi:death-on-curing protein